MLSLPGTSRGVPHDPPAAALRSSVLSNVHASATPLDVSLPVGARLLTVDATAAVAPLGSEALEEVRPAAPGYQQGEEKADADLTCFHLRCS